MKSPEEMKISAVQYLRSDLEILSEQVDDSERRAYHNRAQAILGVIKAAGLINNEEYLALGYEIGEANSKASEQALAAIGS
jgi:hypothetical protein